MTGERHCHLEGSPFVGVERLALLIKLDRGGEVRAEFVGFAPQAVRFTFPGIATQRQLLVLRWAENVCLYRNVGGESDGIKGPENRGSSAKTTGRNSSLG
jgi:hypothetical protein